MKKEIKLKKGDKVWLTVPMNGTIIRINKELGYTIKLDTKEPIEVAYYTDKEVSKLTPKEIKEKIERGQRSEIPPAP